MEKLQKTAKHLDTFFKIIYRVTFAAVIIASVAIAIMWLLYLGDPDILELFHPDLDFGMISFRLADSVAPSGRYGFLFLLLGSVVGILDTIVFCMMFCTIRSILAPLKEGRPFHDEIAPNLKKLGWLTIANGIIGNVGNLITHGNLLSGYNLSELFLSDKITRVTIDYTFTTSFILYAVLLFLLSYIFQYGGELQQLSDETL